MNPSTSSRGLVSVMGRTGLARLNYRSTSLHRLPPVTGTAPLFSRLVPGRLRSGPAGSPLRISKGPLKGPHSDVGERTEPLPRRGQARVERKNRTGVIIRGIWFARRSIHDSAGCLKQDIRMNARIRLRRERDRL